MTSLLLPFAPKLSAMRSSPLLRNSEEASQRLRKFVGEFNVHRGYCHDCFSVSKVYSLVLSTKICFLTRQHLKSMQTIRFDCRSSTTSNNPSSSTLLPSCTMVKRWAWESSHASALIQVSPSHSPTYFDSSNLESASIDFETCNLQPLREICQYLAELRDQV